MPALLSSESKGLPADEHEGKTLKKKKSVMGRLKSKISSTLGGSRKKSFVGDTSPTDSDLKKSSGATATTVSSGPEIYAATSSEQPEAPLTGRNQDDSSDQQCESSFGEERAERKKQQAVQELVEIEPFDAKLVDDDYVDDDDDFSDDNGGNGGNGGSGGSGGSEEKPPAPAAKLADPKGHQEDQQEEAQHAQQQEGDEEEVFASDYKTSKDGSKTYDAKADDYSEDDEDDDDEEKLEVFSEPSDELGNQRSSCESLHQREYEHESETTASSRPGDMDLVVVGLSPHKVLRPVVPQPSPVKKAAPVIPSVLSPVAKDLSHAASPRCFEPAISEEIASEPTEPAQFEERKEKEAEQPLQPKRRGGIKVDLQDDDGNNNSNNDALYSERNALKPPPQFSSSRQRSSLSKKKSERPTAAATAATASPAKRQQPQPLLSDFHFGLELGPSGTRSLVPESPAKRRGAVCSALSPSAAAAHRSSSRDQPEQQMTSSSAPMPSPKKKTMTGNASSRASASSKFSDPQRETLEGIKEEKQHSSGGERPPSPRKVTTSKRRSSVMMTEAPILASAFIGSLAANEPVSHDDHTQSATGEDDEIEEEEDTSGTSSGAFAFDAGAAITQEFGERVARLLGADPWGDRQDGFDAIQYVVKKADLPNIKNRRELFCAAISAIQCGVEDRVAPVMYCALECLRTVLKEFSPVVDRTFLKYPPTNEQLSALVKSLTLKLGDSNKRTQRETSQALLRVAKQKKLKTLPHILLHLSAKEVTPRLQVDTLRQLVSSLGIDSKSGLSLNVVMQFAIPALKIADEKTRKAAVELIADLHMLNGQAVNAQLAGIKSEMLRVINRRVDELIARREKEQVQSTNQAEEAASAGNDEDDLEKGAELVPVPVEDSKKVIALLETQLQQAAGVVGPVAWRKLESKTWSDRKEALVDIEKVMTEAKSDLRDAKPAFGSVIQLNFLAYCVTVYKCLGDSIAPVVNSAMDCLSTLIKVFGPCVEWREESVRDVVLLTIMRLFSTMQKPNSRTNRAACRLILKFARLTNAHTLRYTLSCIFAKETDALVQMHLLRLLIPEFGFQPDGISAALSLSVVASAFVHANEKARKIAIDVALYTQRLVGKEYVLKKLKDVKPVTLKELEKNFAECEMKKDGDRPQTVHASMSSATSGGGDSGLPPVNFGGGEKSRRLLNSAPVGVGKLHCTPQGGDDDEFSLGGGSFRRGSVLSNEEENFMDSILDGGLD